MKRITKITDEQKAKLPELVERWVGYASEQSDYIDIKNAVHEIYRLMGKPAPTVLISDSPYSAIYTTAALRLIKEGGSTLRSTLSSTLGSTLRSTLYSTLRSTLDSTLRSTLSSTLDSTLRSTLGSTLRSTLDNTNDQEFKSALSWAYQGSYIVTWWGVWAGYYEYAKDIGVSFDEDKLNAFINFTRHIPHICVADGIAIVSMKPTKIHWQETEVQPISGINHMPKNRILHADGELAVEFGDGWGIYVFNGVVLPEKIGKVRSKNWDPEWILEEKNQEIKRLLLETIPKEKVSEVLQLKVLDTFKTLYSTYELVEAKNNPYPSPYKAIRMSCPTTNKPYLIRVHPEVLTAENAIVALNKGIHPDTFLYEC